MEKTQDRAIKAMCPNMARYGLNRLNAECTRAKCQMLSVYLFSGTELFLCALEYFT